ncbi:MAG: DUF2170 family protein [Xanthomonadales bacterium]|nr:DUF2170 family protein [Xanthomonadales bacterium]
MPTRKLIPLLKKSLPPLRRKLLLDEIDLATVSGEVPVVELSFPSAERESIFVTDAGSQLLCICYLWREDEVRPDRKTELLTTLLELNPSVPLSSFGVIGHHYVIFGALSPAANAEDMALELATLSDNAVDAIATLADFLG